MRLNIKKRKPRTHRTIKRFLFLPMRWDDSSVVWLEWIEVRQSKVIGMWEDGEYHLLNGQCNCERHSK